MACAGGSPARWWPGRCIRLLGLEAAGRSSRCSRFTPWIAALALLAALVGALLRQRLFTLVCGACALVLAVAIAPRVIPNRAPEDADGVRLRVLAVNVAGDPGTALSVRALIRRYRPDVVSVLELPPEVVHAYEVAGIDELLPHQVLEPRPGFAGTGLYSRIPLRAAPRPVGTLFAIAAASMAPEGAAPLEVFAVHARAPTSPGADAPVAHRPARAAVRPARAGCGSWPATSTPRSTITSCGG